MFLVPPDLGRRTGPSWRAALRGVLLFAIAPGIVLWVAISAFGKLFTGPLKSWNHLESDLNRSLQDTRTQTWDSITAIWSHIGNTEIIISLTVVAVVLVYWRTRRWWFASILPSRSACRQPFSWQRPLSPAAHARMSHIWTQPHPRPATPAVTSGRPWPCSPRSRSWPPRSSGPGCAGL
jgi:hypothetical protein